MPTAARIIVAWLIALSAGLIYWTSPFPQPQASHVAADRQLAEVKALSVSLTQEIRKEALSDRDRHLLERAGVEWRRNPFERQGLASPRQAMRTDPASPLGAYAYSGYMEVDKKRLAIISGMQYQVGDRLEYGKYVIRGIEPEKVVVEDTGKHEQLVLPFVGGGS